MQKRCEWVGSDPLYIEYHDNEWAVPLHDDRKIFEMLVLEGAQAGLNWLTVLRKRENYRKALDNFDPRKVAKYDSKKSKNHLEEHLYYNNSKWFDRPPSPRLWRTAFAKSRSPLFSIGLACQP
jgi:DNA-3-methyladenine glycosylase I